MYSKKSKGKKGCLHCLVRKFFLYLFLLSLLVAQPVSLQKIVSTTAGDGQDRERAILELTKTQEAEITWQQPAMLDTYVIMEQQSLFVNITLLLCSNSSVYFWLGSDPRYSWEPPPENFTLTPGALHTATYFLEVGTDNMGTLTYVAEVLAENSSATVRWTYIVLAKTGLFTFCPVATALLAFVFLSSFAVFLASQKKRRKKNYFG